MDRKTAALYIRVSTDMQTELSPDAQKRLMLDYAKKNNMEISKEYIFYDEGITGRKTRKRTGFNHMIAVAKQKPSPFEVILVHKFSRFARSQEDSIVYKNLLKKQCGVNVISISEPIIEGPYGQLIERVIEWMDEFYSINLGTEVFKGMSEKALRGGYQASPPLGYRVEHKGEGPVIVPEEAKAIQLIFHKYINDKSSIFEITRQMNSLGFRTRSGNLFEKRSIEYILNNPTYAGFVRWNRTTNETNVIKDKSDWIIRKGSHEAIISEDMSNASMQRYESEYRPKKARPSETAKHWLSGVLKCSNCGRTLSATARQYVDGRNYFVFQCIGYNKGKCTVSHSTTGLQIIPVILEALEHAARTGNIGFMTKKTNKQDVDEVDLLQQQLNKITQKEQRIKAAYRDGIDTLKEYKENKELLQEEQGNIMKLIEEMKKSISKSDSKEELIDKISSVYELITSDNISDSDKNQALRNVVEKIVFNKTSKIIQIYYYR